MSDWVPITSAVAGAVVALGVPYIARRETRREQRVKKVDELRALFEEGAGALTDAKFAFDKRRHCHEGKWEETGDAFWSQYIEARMLEDKIAVRVGPDDPVLAEYRRAADALDELTKVVATSPPRGWPDEDPEATRRISSELEEFSQARARFFEYANARAGIEGQP